VRERRLHAGSGCSGARTDRALQLLRGRDRVQPLRRPHGAGGHLLHVPRLRHVDRLRLTTTKLDRRADRLAALRSDATKTLGRQAGSAVPAAAAARRRLSLVERSVRGEGPPETAREIETLSTGLAALRVADVAVEGMPVVGHLQ